MKKAIFEGHNVAVGENYIKDQIFSIDFNGELLVMFKREEVKITCINAVDGYGKNVKHIYEGKELVLE